MRFLRVSLLLSAVVCLGLTGCRQEDDISRATVEHPGREKIRLRVAVIKQGPSVWFFRMSGPVKLMDEYGMTFEDFVKSATFKAGKPSWTDPKGWQKDLPSAQRFASFRTGEKPNEMEMFVVRLSAKGFDLMENMHRWQKQVNVPLSEKHEDLPKPDDNGVTWIDLRGLGLHTVSKPPVPLAANPKRFVDFKKPAQDGEFPFRYTLPDDWVKGVPMPPAAEVFEVGDDLTVTLTPAQGTLDANINRWRHQLDLAPAEPEEIRKSIRELAIPGVKNFYADIANPKGPVQRNRTLGVIIPMAKTNWFVKMSGPSDTVGQHKDEFEAFVKSFKLEGR